MNPHYQYFLAANGDAVSIKDDGRLKPTKPMVSDIIPTKPIVSPIVESSKPAKEKPNYIGEEKPLPPPTGTATRYKTCYAGCPDTEAVSVAMSDVQKNVKCPSSHPFSFKPSCNGGNLLEQASTRPIGGGGIFGKPSNKQGIKKKNWLPVILILGGVGVFILKPFK